MVYSYTVTFCIFLPHLTVNYTNIRKKEWKWMLYRSPLRIKNYPIPTTLMYFKMFKKTNVSWNFYVAVSFGGAAALFLGCSFLSGIEIIYLTMAFVLRKKKITHKTTTKKTWPKDFLWWSPQMLLRMFPRTLHIPQELCHHHRINYTGYL